MASSDFDACESGCGCYECSSTGAIRMRYDDELDTDNIYVFDTLFETHDQKAARREKIVATSEVLKRDLHRSAVKNGDLDILPRLEHYYLQPFEDQLMFMHTGFLTLYKYSGWAQDLDTSKALRQVMRRTKVPYQLRQQILRPMPGTGTTPSVEVHAMKRKAPDGGHVEPFVWTGSHSCIQAVEEAIAERSFKNVGPPQKKTCSKKIPSQQTQDLTVNEDELEALRAGPAKEMSNAEVRERFANTMFPLEDLLSDEED